MDQSQMNELQALSEHGCLKAPMAPFPMQHPHAKLTLTKHLQVHYETCQTFWTFWLKPSATVALEKYPLMICISISGFLFSYIHPSSLDLHRGAWGCITHYINSSNLFKIQFRSDHNYRLICRSSLWFDISSLYTPYIFLGCVHQGWQSPRLRTEPWGSHLGPAIGSGADHRGLAWLGFRWSVDFEMMIGDLWFWGCDRYLL